MATTITPSVSSMHSSVSMKDIQALSAQKNTAKPQEEKVASTTTTAASATSTTPTDNKKDAGAVSSMHANVSKKEIDALSKNNDASKTDTSKSASTVKSMHSSVTLETKKEGERVTEEVKKTIDKDAKDKIENGLKNIANNEATLKNLQNGTITGGGKKYEEYAKKNASDAAGEIKSTSSQYTSSSMDGFVKELKNKYADNQNMLDAINKLFGSQAQNPLAGQTAASTPQAAAASTGKGGTLSIAG